MSIAMQPLVSIILATYNRPETLRLAIASVLEQTLTDWELLVIGDACGAETAAVVEAAADPRIHYINLIRTVGEQSGPNNVGIARARGRHIAFLNHDDLWLPDHLQAALEWLQATGADLVFPATAVIMPCTAEQLAAHIWRTYVHGIGRDGSFDPVETFAPASSWLMRREAAERTGYWKAARDCVTESSREYLFRAWRRGLQLRALPWVSVIAFHSGARANSYVLRDAHEQEWFWHQVLHNPLLRQQLLARAGNDEVPPRSALQYRLLRWLAAFGLFPAALEYRARGLRRGQLIDRLRRTRGLHPLADAHGGLREIRRLELARAPAYTLGSTLSFRSDGAAVAIQSYGWSYPEPQGTWTDGPEAGLSLPLAAPEHEDLELEVEAQCFVTEGWPRQRVHIHLGEHALAEWLFDTTQNHGLRTLRIPADIAQHSPLRLRLYLPDAQCPRELGLGNDSRRLGLNLVSLRLTPAVQQAPALADAADRRGGPAPAA
jgi:glycosyltransferase involved in cell wall biosynthesis